MGLAVPTPTEQPAAGAAGPAPRLLLRVAPSERGGGGVLAARRTAWEQPLPRGSPGNLGSGGFPPDPSGKRSLESR